MKGFVASLLLFGALLGVIVFNSLYVTRACQDLQAALQALPPVAEADAAAAALCSLWEHEESKLRVSVSQNMLDKINAIFAELTYAVRFNDAVSFEKCRLLAIQSFKEIEDNEGLIPKNWI